MKKVGDIILAFGIVALLAVIAEFAFNLRLFPSDGFILLLFMVGGLVFVLFGIIIRNVGKKRTNNQ